MTAPSLSDINPMVKSLELTFDEYLRLKTGELTYTFQDGKKANNYLDKDLLKAYCINPEGMRLICFCIIDEYYLTGDYIPVDKKNPIDILTKNIKEHLTLHPIDLSINNDLPAHRPDKEYEISEINEGISAKPNQVLKIIIGNHEISISQSVSREESILISSFLKQLLE